ncbi:MAG: porin, partial [Gammaproteobacteria bacterium]|nr:porin [Gammaproteobacteria bacterium]
MNKPTLSLAAAALLAQATAISAAPEITVYGKANVTLNSVDEESVDPLDPDAAIDEWQLNSNASRLGVKGKHAVNEDLNAIFQLEYEVFIDDGTNSENNALKQRNIYAGLQGEFGTVIAGKHDTPLKLAQGKID